MTMLVLDEAAATARTEDTVTAAEVMGATADGYLIQLISKVCARFGPAGNPEALSWDSIVANAPCRLSTDDLAYLMNRGPAVVQRVLDQREIIEY